MYTGIGEGDTLNFGVAKLPKVLDEVRGERYIFILTGLKQTTPNTVKLPFVPEAVTLCI